MTSNRVFPAVVAAIVVAYGIASACAGAQGRLFTNSAGAEVVPRTASVRADIRDRVATVEVVQRFFNPNPAAVEGDYVFPLPPGVAISKFSLRNGSQTLVGRVLEGTRARATYEQIVRRRQDPALLEFLEWGLFRARVFPIPPRSEVSLRLQYEILLETEGGITTFRIPGAPTGLGGAGGASEIRVDLRTTAPLKTVYSPTHPITVKRTGERRANVSLQSGRTGGHRDFLLYFASDERPFGLSVLTHRAAGEDGYFLALVSPKVEHVSTEVDPKDFVFVLDTSGSMSGKKLEQAKDAIRFCLRNLGSEDRFGLIAFDFGPESFRPALVAVSPETVAAALVWVGRLEAGGGTDIQQALHAAAKLRGKQDRLGITLFLTDGKPTVGTLDEAEIRAAARSTGGTRHRLFVFGVGDDLNTRLLDRLAEENRGARTYVSDRESIEHKVSVLYRKVKSPVLSNVELQFEGEKAKASDWFPRSLPDLFAGSRLLVLGRYSGSGPCTVRLRGTLRTESHTFTYTTVLPETNPNQAFLPRLWAMRKIGFVIDQIRLHGENRELVDTVVTLGRRHGVVTPYTAFLVVEDDARLATAAGGSRVAGVNAALDDLRRQAGGLRSHGTRLLGRTSGPAATGVSRATGRLRGAAMGPVPYTGPSGGVGANLQPPGSRTSPTTPVPPPTPSGASAASGRASPAGGAAVTRRAATSKGAGIFSETDTSESAAFFLGRKTRPGRKNQRKAGPAERRQAVRRHPVRYRAVGTRTFLRLQGVWVDTQYDPTAKSAKKLVRVEALSDAYFALVRSHPALGKCLRLGPRVIVVVGGRAFFIGPSEKKSEKK